LERRVSRSGQDSVDHPKHGSDDYANALVGALWAGRSIPEVKVPPGIFVASCPREMALGAVGRWP
jgi:hypothetical protein